MMEVKGRCPLPGGSRESGGFGQDECGCTGHVPSDAAWQRAVAEGCLNEPSAPGNLRSSTESTQHYDKDVLSPPNIPSFHLLVFCCK